MIDPEKKTPREALTAARTIVWNAERSHIESVKSESDAHEALRRAILTRKENERVLAEAYEVDLAAYEVNYAAEQAARIAELERRAAQLLPKPEPERS